MNIKSYIYIDFINILYFIILYLNLFPTISTLYFYNPISVCLSNGNIFIIHKYGIDVCNHNVTKIVKSPIVFSKNEYLTKDNLSKVIIKFFNNNYIISLILEKIYIFDYNGNFLYKSDNINNGKIIDYYTLGILSNEINYYNYFVGFISDNYLYLYYYQYDKINNKTEKVASREKFKCKLGLSVKTYNVKNSGLSCHKMKHSDYGETLTCFYILYDDDKEYFAIGFYKKELLTIIENIHFRPEYQECSDINFLKSDIYSNLSIVLICIVTSKGNNNCFHYNIHDPYSDGFTLNYFNCNQNLCRNNYYSLKVNYYPQKDQYIFSCAGNNGNISFCIFNSSFSFNEINKFEQCESVYGYSTIYSKTNKEYYIISDEICDENEKIIEPLFDNEINEEKEEEEEEEEEENHEEKSEDIIESKCELVKCKTCDSNSQLKNLCINCNTLEGYYPINISLFSRYKIYEFNDKYIDCFNDETKPSKFYFNKLNKDYEPCFQTCASCEYEGNEKYNNCTSCEIGYMLIQEFNNCVLQCPFYYYIYYGQYRCTLTYQFPENYYLLITEKAMCINNCFNDDIYKYQYNGECLKTCPTNSSSNYKDYICRDNNRDVCLLSERDFIIPQQNITEINIENLAKTYINEFNYTNNHVSLFRDNQNLIIFYKNEECISELSLEISQIDFGECYEKVRNNYSISDKIVLGIVNQKKEGINYPKLTSFSMYDPNKGDVLEINDICENDTILVQENIKIRLDDKYNYDFINYLAEQNIDVFNISSDFYNDICFRFDSPIDKDISLKDRVSLFFPNVTLCEDRCTIKGVDTIKMRAKCECIFNNLINNNIFSDNLWYQNQIGQIQEIVSQTNIYIIKCFKEFFKYKYFISSFGGYILITLLILQIITTIFYFIKSPYQIRKYIFEIIDIYISYLLKEKQKDKEIIHNFPPKKNDTENKIYDKDKKKINLKKLTFVNKVNKINYRTNIKNKFKDNILVINNINNNNSSSSSHEMTKMALDMLLKPDKENKLRNNIFSSKKNLKNLAFYSKNDKKIKSKNDKNYTPIEKYMKTDFDDMEFEDALIKDKRKFLKTFCDRIKKNLIIVNIIFNKEPFNLRAIKLILIILHFDIYLCINGLFFNEMYISKIFYLNEEDEHFFSFIPRCLDRVFYTILGIISFNNIIEFFFFIEEKKIKDIFKREKNNHKKLKNRIYQILIKVLNKFIFFIIISFIITIFSIYYICCFNNIYPYIRYEWIKSSIFIIIIMQIFWLVTSLLETILRKISFILNSEKIYKINSFLS